MVRERKRARKHQAGPTRSRPSSSLREVSPPPVEPHSTPLVRTFCEAHLHDANKTDAPAIDHIAPCPSTTSEQSQACAKSGLRLCLSKVHLC